MFFTTLAMLEIDRTKYKTWKQTQGFLTSENRFVDRIEGGKIAAKAGQVSEDKAGFTIYSEDLY